MPDDTNVSNPRYGPDPHGDSGQVQWAYKYGPAHYRICADEADARSRAVSMYLTHRFVRSSE